MIDQPKPPGKAVRLRASCGGFCCVHAHIVGEHGDSEFPLWSSARIGSVPTLDWQPAGGEPMTAPELDELAVDVRDAAYRVIQGKGATNYAIGVAATRIVEAILSDERAVMPVSTVLDGFHGISGVALSVPSIGGAVGATPVRETRFSDDELGRLPHSADVIRAPAQSLSR